MKKLLLLCCLLLVFPAHAAETVRYGGATTLQKGYMPEAAKVFGARHGVEFKIQGGNTGPGMRLLVKGRLDLAGGGRFLREEEKQAGLVEVQVGWDALIPIVNASNPIDDLSKEQLKGIFSGRIKNWKEVGGNDESIIVYTSPKGSGVRKAQQKSILEGGEFAPQERPTRSPAAAVPNVGAKPGAIGAISKGQILTQPHDKIKMLSVDGVKPSPKAIAKQEYTLVKPLILATKGEARGTLKAFIEFTLSEEGRKIMNRYFYSLEE